MSRNRENYHKEWYQKNKERILKENEAKKELKKEYDAEYREKNKDKLNEYYNSEEYKKHKKEYRDKNKEALKETAKKYKENNKEAVKEYNKKYRENNKDNNNEYQRNYRKHRRKNNPLYKLIESARTMIRTSIKQKGYMKKSRTHEILGCSFEDFKIHLEKQFTEWMTWENYGNPVDGLIEPNKTWDIDHIIPLASANNEKELLKLNHYTNLQPLCSYHNRFVKRDN